MADSKNPTAVLVGQRIKQARRMADMETAEQLLKKIPDWGRSRLGNYEAGISLPAPDDVRIIAEATGASPCWIMFGIGPIRASGRDQQAIRHQNLVTVVERAKRDRTLSKLLKAMGIARKKLDAHLIDPFLHLSDRLIRPCEQWLGKPSGWMDEQHVETDPVCQSFPSDMRRMMEIYSNLSSDRRALLLRIAEAFDP